MARVFQDTREKRVMGNKAPWYVEWRENGRRRSQKIGPKGKAQKFASLKEAEALQRRNGLPIDKTWAEFRKEYESRVVATMISVRSQEKAKQVLETFEKTMRPQFVGQITKATIDDYASRRLRKPGKKKGSKLSPNTVKSELRTLRAALSVAVGWGYLAIMPPPTKIKAHEEDKPFVTAEHFDALMKACHVATMPRPAVHPGQNYTPEEWWRGLLAVAWVTGMRIGALLAVRWEDVDLDAGVILSRARHNKGKRDQRHQVKSVVGLLEPLRGFDPRVFPWNHHRRTLDDEFARIQTAAGIRLHCPKADEHECTDACHLYGFHSLRYAHATYNFGRVEDRDLQQQMGHASFETTKHYIKYAEKQQAKVYDAFLPGSLKPLASVGG